jgi:hypothetical protein
LFFDKQAFFEFFLRVFGKLMEKFSKTYLKKLTIYNSMRLHLLEGVRGMSINNNNEYKRVKK